MRESGFKFRVLDSECADSESVNSGFRFSGILIFAGLGFSRI